MVSLVPKLLPAPQQLSKDVCLSVSFPSQGGLLRPSLHTRNAWLSIHADWH